MCLFQEAWLYFGLGGWGEDFFSLLDRKQASVF